MTTISDIAEGFVTVHEQLSTNDRLTWTDYFFTEKALRSRVDFIDTECKRNGIECKHRGLRPQNKPWPYIKNGE